MFPAILYVLHMEKQKMQEIKNHNIPNEKYFHISHEIPSIQLQRFYKMFDCSKMIGFKKIQTILYVAGTTSILAERLCPKEESSKKIICFADLCQLGSLIL